MRIGVLGTGMVGRTMSAKLDELGHDIMAGTRDPAALARRTEPDAMGNPPFAEWQARHQGVRVGAFAEAAAHGELVVNATSGAGSLDALHAAGEQNLSGKILIDIANPLDFSGGAPTLLFCNTDSLGERIQRAFPAARVVKTLNTVNAHVMVDPGLVAGGEHTMFMSGNDPEAKAEVGTILGDWFGWTQVVDLGDITAARATEMYMPLWLRLFGQRGDPRFNIAVVR